MANWFGMFYIWGQTAVRWLANMEIAGAPVLGIIAACFITGVLLRSLLYKP